MRNKIQKEQKKLMKYIYRYEFTLDYLDGKEEQLRELSSTFFEDEYLVKKWEKELRMIFMRQKILQQKLDSKRNRLMHLQFQRQTHSNNGR